VAENDSGRYTLEEGYRQMTRILQSGAPRPDGVFAASDSLAWGALRAIMDAGLRVPEDIAVIGYDDIPVASAFTPLLTTVKQPVEKMGNEAFVMTLEAMQGKVSKPRNLVFEPELVKRESA